ncbi:hypothetical protein [Sphingomonas sp. ID0503]|uniref:hypothetical protein n=1 Tax=Sphingomonas sp. ID0503 TaxID=3399691 RepID=UPI003AFA0AB9
MASEPHPIIDNLGGTSAVAKLVHRRPSTVHSWREVGISKSNLDHIRLAAGERGRGIDWNAYAQSQGYELSVDHDASDTVADGASSPGNSEDVSHGATA